MNIEIAKIENGYIVENYKKEYTRFYCKNKAQVIKKVKELLNVVEEVVYEDSHLRL